MAEVSGYIVGTGQTIVVSLPTVRAPEMPVFTDIADDDIWIGWDKSDNKSRTATTSLLREKFIGNSTPETPVLQNGVMEYVVPDSADGSNRLDIAALAGKNFEFERRGVGTYLTSEFDILDTGGILLTREGDYFESGDKLRFRVVQLQGGQPLPGAGGGQSFITGIKLVDNNITLVKGDMGNLINVAGGDNKVVVIVPDVTTLDENTIIPIETMVNNNWQTSIATQNGQNLYFRGTSLQNVFMGKSEVLWLISSADGYYVINSYGNFLDVGYFFSGYGNELNAVQARGQELLRASYPRLWEKAQTLGGSLITDAQWLSSVDYCGCYSTGNGTTTFRVPDLRGTSLSNLDNGRGLNQSTRTLNSSGGYQDGMVKVHDHTMHGKGTIAASNGTQWYLSRGTGRRDYSGNGDDYFGRGGGPDEGMRTGDTGSAENTVKNIGYIGMIKC